MTALKQSFRSVLTEVEKFLVETIKGLKLSKSQAEQKDRLLEKIRCLLEEIPGSTNSTNQIDSGGSASNGSQKISNGGDGSSGSVSNIQPSPEEDNYSNNVPKVAASNLKNKLQSGLLDKKTKKALRAWESRYCVVSGNIFYLYKKQTDSKQKEAFCMTGYEFREAPGLEKDANKKEMCFELIKPGATTYQFRAGSKEGVIEWRDAITKGIQMTSASPATDEDGVGEVYEDVGAENNEEIPPSLPASLPPPPAPLPPPPQELFDDQDDIYEDTEDPLPPPPPHIVPPLPPQPPPKEVIPPEPEDPAELYDDCMSTAMPLKMESEKITEKSESLPPLLLPPGKHKELPSVPALPTEPLPPRPTKAPPKADLPPLPNLAPPVIPVRKASAGDITAPATPASPPPPLPSAPPPLPNRNPGMAVPSFKVPHLRSPFVGREEDFEFIYYGKWDCSADTNKELSFKRGDLIHILSQDLDAESWWVGEHDGKIGLVPKEYMSPAYELVC